MWSKLACNISYSNYKIPNIPGEMLFRTELKRSDGSSALHGTRPTRGRHALARNHQSLSLVFILQLSSHLKLVSSDRRTQRPV